MQQATQRIKSCRESEFSANGHVRFAPESGHVQCTSSCLLWANSGHYTSLYSVTSSALARSVGGTVMPSTLAVLRLNQFELCGLLDWWRRNAHDACTILVRE